MNLKLLKTDKIVGSAWHEYQIENREEVPYIDTVLMRNDGDKVDLTILYKSNEQVNSKCVAKFWSYGRMIDCIKTFREKTSWGLRESKDFIESFPKDITLSDGFSKETLRALVVGVKNTGGRAEFCEGNCDTCEARFRCFTER